MQLLGTWVRFDHQKKLEILLPRQSLTCENQARHDPWQPLDTASWVTLY